MNLFRAFATVGGSTLISRVLGFVRDVLMAAYLGSGPVADAFFVAFRFPNLFRRWFAEGAFNAAFVPLFSRRLEEEGEDSARKFASEALSVLGFTLIIFTAIAELFMPLWMRAFAPGFYDDPEKFNLAVLLTRIAFPYLFCMSLIALLSGVLNATGRFLAAAAAPILLNVILISVLSAIALFNHGETPLAGIWLAWGVAASGAVQLALLMWSASRAGFALKLQSPKLTPGVRRLVHLGVPGVIAGGVTQINLFIGTIIASLQASAVSYLYYADRIYQLPLGMIGIAIGVVLLPDLSRRLRGDNPSSAMHAQNRALEYSMLLTLPAAIALAVIPAPIISVLFERGAFSESDRLATTAALMAFAVGLPAFVLIKVFSPGYFAREDTRTPMIFAAIGVAVNIVASLALFPFLGHVGIAIATSVSGWINGLLLLNGLRKRDAFVLDDALIHRLPRMIAASVGMGGALYASASIFMPLLVGPAANILVRASLLGLWIVGGAAVFFGLAQILGATDIRDLARRFTKRSA